MKKCPYCAHEIDDNVTKCLFCGVALIDSPKPKKPRWYFRTTSIVVGFLVVGPFILPAVWVNPHYSRKKKIVVTLVIVAITFWLAFYTAKAVSVLSQYYGIISGAQSGNY